MTHIIVATHGKFSEEIVNSAAMVYGEDENCHAFDAFVIQAQPVEHNIRNAVFFCSVQIAGIFRQNHFSLFNQSRRNLTQQIVFVLAIEGKTLSSEEFSKQLEQASINGFSTLTFVIGGSLGLSNEVKKRANLSVSFGRLTIPHQLMRLVLVEQIYRAFTIQQGSPYHK